MKHFPLVRPRVRSFTLKVNSKLVKECIKVFTGAKLSHLTFCFEHHRLSLEMRCGSSTRFIPAAHGKLRTKMRPSFPVLCAGGTSGEAHVLAGTYLVPPSGPFVHPLNARTMQPSWRSRNNHYAGTWEAATMGNTKRPIQ